MSAPAPTAEVNSTSVSTMSPQQIARLNDQLVATAAGDEGLGVPDDVDAETALLVARQLAQYRRPDLHGAVRSRRIPRCSCSIIPPRVSTP